MWFLFGEVSFFSWVLGMGYVVLLWHSLSLPYNYFEIKSCRTKTCVNKRKHASLKQARFDMHVKTVHVHDPLDANLSSF